MLLMDPASLAGENDSAPVLAPVPGLLARVSGSLERVSGAVDGGGGEPSDAAAAVAVAVAADTDVVVVAPVAGETAGGVDGSEEEEEGEEGDEEEDGAAVLWRSLRIHSVPGSSLGTKKKNGATAAVIRAGRRTPSHHAPTHVADSGPTSSGAWPRVTHTSRKTPPRRNPMAGPSAERAYRVPM